MPVLNLITVFVLRWDRPIDHVRLKKFHVTAAVQTSLQMKMGKDHFLVLQTDSELDCCITTAVSLESTVPSHAGLLSSKCCHDPDLVQYIWAGSVCCTCCSRLNMNSQLLSCHLMPNQNVSQRSSGRADSRRTTNQVYAACPPERFNSMPPVPAHVPPVHISHCKYIHLCLGQHSFSVPNLGQNLARTRRQLKLWLQASSCRALLGISQWSAVQCLSLISCTWTCCLSPHCMSMLHSPSTY